jgi:uncharacterized protein (DUF433 family)
MAQSRIITDPKIMSGKPTLAGTRITVEPILEKLAARRDGGPDSGRTSEPDG